MAYRAYNDSNIIDKAKEVKSIAGLIRELNLIPAGGNYRTMKKHLQRLNVDTAHWTGQAWNRGERLKDWATYTRGSQAKKHLIKERGVKCERCTLIEWLSQPIPLEIHHKDGNATNNTYENLQLLCPNCHALTDNWRGRGKLN